MSAIGTCKQTSDTYFRGNKNDIYSNTVFNAQNMQVPEIR